MFDDKPSRQALMLGIDAEPRQEQVELLERAGWTVQAVATLASAVDVLQLWNPDVLVLDAASGDEPDREYLRAVLDTRPNRRLPVVMLIERPDLAAMMMGVREGAHAVFTRPVDPQRLARRLVSDPDNNAP